jgi:hypothetical protein
MASQWARRRAIKIVVAVSVVGVVLLVIATLPEPRHIRHMGAVLAKDVRRSPCFETAIGISRMPETFDLRLSFSPKAYYDSTPLDHVPAWVSSPLTKLSGVVPVFFQGVGAVGVCKSPVLVERMLAFVEARTQPLKAVTLLRYLTRQ